MKKFKLINYKETYMLLSIAFMFLVLVVSLFFSIIRENGYLERIDSMKTELRNKDKDLDDAKDTIDDQNKIILDLTNEINKKENNNQEAPEGELPNEG